MSGACRWIVLALVMAILSVTVLGDLRHQDWSYDDEDYIRSARHAGGDIAYLLRPYKEDLEGQFNAARPTVHLYFWLARPLLGEDPGRYHLANVAVHTFNALLLSIIVYAWCGRFLLAALTGVLFLQNISHFRAVYWVAGIGMLLGTLLGFGSVLAMMSYLRTRRPIHWWLSLLLFFLAPFAHESTVVFIGLLAVKTVGCEGMKRGLRLIAPHAAIIVIAWTVSQFVYNTPLSRESDYQLGLHMLRNLPVMIFNLFAGGYYEVRWLPIAAAAKVAAGTILLAALALLARSIRPLIVAVVWLLLAILPYLPFVDGTYAWRYHYLPATAASLLMAAALVWIGRKMPGRLRFRAARSVIPIALTIVLVGTAYSHTDYLQAVQHSFSGMYLLRHNHYERALTQYEWADTKAGNHPFAYRWQFNKALTLLSLERVDEGYGLLLHIVARYPSYEKAPNVLLQLFARRHGLGGVGAGGDGSVRIPAELRSILKGEVVSAARSGKWEEAKGLSTIYLLNFPSEPQMEAIFHESADALRRREGS